MATILRTAVLLVVLASSAGAIKVSAAPLPESLAVTASSLGRNALDDPAAFAFVASLTTEIGQRLAGTEAHKRAVAWAEAKLKAAGFDNVHSEPFTFPAWIRGAESAEIGDRGDGEREIACVDCPPNGKIETFDRRLGSTELLQEPARDDESARDRRITLHDGRAPAQRRFDLVRVDFGKAYVPDLPLLLKGGEQSELIFGRDRGVDPV